MPEELPDFVAGSTTSTRVASGKALNDYTLSIPLLIGGSADVAGSVNTLIKDDFKFGLEPHGHNVYYGVREHAMSLAQSGILLYGLVRPYVGCFLVFMDYLKPSLRTQALMGLPSINIFTHDSIAVGEDGPTHQPIEHINSLRLIPNTVNIRPSGALETMYATRFALENTSNPVNLILSRQSMPIPCDVSYEEFKKGAYIVKDYKDYDLVLITTGSEVKLGMEVSNELSNHNIKARVISMPSVELFEQNSNGFKEGILGRNREKIIAIEMGSSALWYKYASIVFGIDSFGASGKASDVINHYKFTKDDITSKILELLNKR